MSDSDLTPDPNMSLEVPPSSLLGRVFRGVPPSEILADWPFWVCYDPERGPTDPARICLFVEGSYLKQVGGFSYPRSRPPVWFQKLDFVPGLFRRFRIGDTA